MWHGNGWRGHAGPSVILGAAHPDLGFLPKCAIKIGTWPIGSNAMTTNTSPRLVADLKPKYEVKVDLDDRAFLFPAGKSVAQLLFLSDGKRINVEAVYPFNQSRTPPRLLTLDVDDAKEFARRLIEAVHHARTQLVVTAGIRITINVVANGYHLQIGDLNAATELFLSTACIWRVCQGLLRIVDLMAPVEAH